jgi:hypothetical protein
MPDDNTPTQKEGDFTFEIDPKGNLFLDGIEVERTINPLRMTAAGDPEEAQDKIEESDPEITPNPQDSAEPNSPAPEVRETIGKKKFNLNVRGEELELELDDSGIIETLQKGVAYDKRLKEFEELSAKERDIIPFQNIIKSTWFKTKLDQAVQAGEIDGPSPAPPPTEKDIAGYFKRVKDPDFSEIAPAMDAYLKTRPQYEAQDVLTNHREFNRVYDNLKAARAELNPPAPQTPTPIATKEVAEAVLATKEIRKDSARSERSGLHPAEFDSEKAAKQRVAVLQKKSRAGDLNASIELARILFGNEMG